jgi:hypothetical protein
MKRRRLLLTCPAGPALFGRFGSASPLSGNHEDQKGIAADATLTKAPLQHTARLSAVPADIEAISMQSYRCATSRLHRVACSRTVEGWNGLSISGDGQDSAEVDRGSASTATSHARRIVANCFHYESTGWTGHLLLEARPCSMHRSALAGYV